MPRPPHPRLSREQISAAALELIDEHGSFTLTELARRLGVRPSSIYNHVSGRAEIIEGIRGMLSGGSMTAPLDGLPWDEAVAVWARRYRETMAAHPRVIPSLVGQTVRHPNTIAAYENLARALDRAGLDADDLVTAVTILDNFVLGAALDTTAPVDVWARAGDDDSVLARAVAASRRSGRDRADTTFETGLRAIIDGLRTINPSRRS